MALSEFLNIASFANAIEAEQVRGVLEADGIPAFVDGANSSTALSHVGTALGGVKLFVRTADAAKARELIDSLMEPSDASSETWFCEDCQEENDGEFQLCWICHQPREDAGQMLPDKDRKNYPTKTVEPDTPVNFDLPEDFSNTSANPYAPPLSKSDIISPGQEPLKKKLLEINPEAEANILRAWRAALIGIVILPILLNIYSIILLYRASKLEGDLSPAAQRRFYGAILFNVVVFVFYGTVTFGMDLIDSLMDFWLKDPL